MTTLGKFAVILAIPFALIMAVWAEFTNLFFAKDDKE